MNQIFLCTIARAFVNIDDVYTRLYLALAVCRLGSPSPVRIEGIEEAVETILPKASPELKAHTRQSFIEFARSFSEQTGLEIIE
jgi:hypothetical protein